MKIHKRSLPETRKRLKVNWRLFIGTLLALSILAPSLYFLHAVQLGRVKSALKSRYESQIAQEDWIDASATIQKVMLLEPTNTEFKIKLAEVLDKAIGDQAGFESYGFVNQIIASQSIALGVCESDETLADREASIRKRMLLRLIQVGRFEDAMNQVAELATPTSDPFLLKNLALLRYSMAMENRSHSFSDSRQVAIPDWLYAASNLNVIDLLLKALIDNPGDIDLSSALSKACLGSPDMLAKSQLANLTQADLRDRAISTADKMLASNRESLDAWLSHYEIASRLDIVRAESDIRQALSMAPENPVVLRQAGSHYLERAIGANRVVEKQKRQEWLELAEKHFRNALELGLKDDGALYLGLGDALLAKGQTDEAVEIWEDGVRVSKPPTAILWSRIAQTWGGLKETKKMFDSLTSMDSSIREESNELSKRGLGVLSRIAKQQWASYYGIQGDYLQAANYLQEVVLGDQDLDAENQSEIYSSLGMCYMRIGQFDRAVEAYQNAIALTPSVDERHRGLFEAMVSTNRIKEALDEHERISEKIATDYLRACETMLVLQRSRTPDPAIWERFDQAFKQALDLSPSDPFLIERPWVLELLQLDSAMSRVDDSQNREQMFEQAQKRLDELGQRYPDSVELQRLLMQKFVDLGNDEKARSILAKLDSSGAANEVDMLLFKIDRMLKDGMKDEARKLLAERLASEPDNPALQNASMRLDLGTRDVSSQVKLDASYSKNISALIEAGRALVATPILVPEGSGEKELKVAADLWARNITEIETQLRELEGIQGTEWRYLRARRLLAQIELDRGSDFSEVEVLTNYLGQYRPVWKSTFVLSGMVEDAKGNVQNAIRDFSRAIRLGEEGIKVYERLAELMLSQGLVGDVSTLLERLGNRRNQSQRLSSIAIGLANRDQVAMVALAKEGVDSRPRDPMAWVWLAQTTELASRGLPSENRDKEIAKSEEAIERALELAGGSSLPVFDAAFGFYFLTKQNQKTDALIEAVGKSKLEPTTRSLCLANMYQVLDRMDLANAALLEARKTAKNPSEIDDRIARLYVAQGKQNEAIDLFKEIFEGSNDAQGTARRSYVTLLANRGADSDWSTIETIYENDKYSNNPDDMRLRAELLARKGKQKDLAKAQYILESLVEDSKNRTDQDRFRLASIYIMNANLAEIQDAESPQVKQLMVLAGKQLSTLCRSNQVPVEYLYTYGDFLIKQDRIVEATDISDRLGSQDPESFASAYLKSRLQLISGNLDRAKTLMMAWKDTQLAKLPKDAPASQQAEILARTGDALGELGASSESEEILRQAYELDSNRGINYVRSLARTENANAKQAAIRYLLEKLRNEKKADTARLLAGLLSVGSIPEELADEGDAILSEIGGQNDSNAELLLSIADMWLAQKKSSKAIDSYRKIVKLRPNDVVALNNLAILLGEQPDGTQEALSLIDQAIRIAGKQPLLLDSKAAILMLANRVDEAIPILEIAASSTNDPRVMFHLYLALRRAGREEEADRLKSKINIIELKKSILTPDDQSELERFEQANP